MNYNQCHHPHAIELSPPIMLSPEQQRQFMKLQQQGYQPQFVSEQELRIKQARNLKIITVKTKEPPKQLWGKLKDLVYGKPSFFRLRSKSVDSNSTLIDLYSPKTSSHKSESDESDESQFSPRNFRGQFIKRDDALYNAPKHSAPRLASKNVHESLVGLAPTHTFEQQTPIQQNHIHQTAFPLLNQPLSNSVNLQKNQSHQKSDARIVKSFEPIVQRKHQSHKSSIDFLDSYQIYPVQFEDRLASKSKSQLPYQGQEQLPYQGQEQLPYQGYPQSQTEQLPYQGYQQTEQLQFQSNPKKKSVLQKDSVDPQTPNSIHPSQTSFEHQFLSSLTLSHTDCSLDLDIDGMIEKYSS